MFWNIANKINRVSLQILNILDNWAEKSFTFVQGFLVFIISQIHMQEAAFATYAPRCSFMLNHSNCYCARILNFFIVLYESWDTEIVRRRSIKYLLPSMNFAAKYIDGHSKRTHRIQTTFLLCFCQIWTFVVATSELILQIRNWVHSIMNNFPNLYCEKTLHTWYTDLADVFAPLNLVKWM